MQSIPPPKQFLFIEKSDNIASVSKCSPHEKATVQRHVQSGRKRPRVARQKKTAQTSSNLLEHYQVNFAVEIPSNDSHLANSDLNHTDGSQRENTSGQVFSTRPPPQDQRFRNTGWATKALTYRTSLIMRDPFDAASVRINQSVASLLDYYMFYYHPSLWPNELVLLRQGIYAFPESVRDIMQTAITDKLTMYCLLSASVCRLKFIDRLPVSQATESESYLISNALRLMSSYVTAANFKDSCEVKRCLVCMIYLSSAESYRGDSSAAKTHLAPTARILEPFGGLTFIKDDNLKGQLAMADLALASINLQPCLFDCSYDPGPAFTLNLRASELHHTPYVASTASSLLNMSDMILPSELRACVEQLVESHTVKTRIMTSSMQPTRAIMVTHWISLRNMAIRSRLLALKIVDPKIRALRAAMIMWSLLFNISGRLQTVKIMASKLQSILAGTTISSWKSHEDLRFWIVLVGFYCAADGSEDSVWFKKECHSLNCCHRLPIDPDVWAPSLLEQLEHFQLRFFYDISVQTLQTRTLETELQRVSSCNWCHHDA